MKTSLATLLILPALALAQDCAQWPPQERPLCEKQRRSTAIVENFVQHSPLDQEGSFQRIEQMKAAEQANAAVRAAPPTVVGQDGNMAGYGVPRTGGDHIGRNALAEHAAIDRAQSAAGRRNPSHEALLRQSEALGVAPVLPDETRVNIDNRIHVDATLKVRP